MDTLYFQSHVENAESSEASMITNPIEFLAQEGEVGQDPLPQHRNENQGKSTTDS